MFLIFLMGVDILISVKFIIRSLGILMNKNIMIKILLQVIEFLLNILVPQPHNSVVTPTSLPYCVPTATQDAVESPRTPWGRSETSEGRSEDPNMNMLKVNTGDRRPCCVLAQNAVGSP